MITNTSGKFLINQIFVLLFKNQTRTLTQFCLKENLKFNDRNKNEKLRPNRLRISVANALMKLESQTIFEQIFFKMLAPKARYRFSFRKKYN
ncbi:hypothetical protein BpHYR1_031949 [Brachionus plicatilis]|uniref:Uncharacterized protein n=1 Tax=Brachionus plicatilis TaxID=10195 RepID=A0A3M7T6H9_BRAPC|nr:hypothetical protein BpHYR1_031949 [Brachionus plicatilis]